MPPTADRSALAHPAARLREEGGQQARGTQMKTICSHEPQDDVLVNDRPRLRPRSHHAIMELFREEHWKLPGSVSGPAGKKQGAGSWGGAHQVPSGARARPRPSRSLSARPA